jgi:ATP/maltotriose-dependent transcriptional regulator MalT
MICPTCGRPEPRQRGLGPLTERQREILAYAADGQSLASIADALYLSLETVRWHVKRSYWALQVHTREDAIQRARDLDLI